MFYNNNINDSEMFGDVEPLKVRLKVENRILAFENDTGSSISAISKRDFDKFKPFGNVRKTTCNFRSYIGDTIIPLGTLKVMSRLKVIVEFQKIKRELKLFVLPGISVPIVDRNWLQALDIVQFNKTVEKQSVKARSVESNDICKRFNFEIKHIRGQDKQPADILPRISREEISELVELKESKEYEYLKVVGKEVQNVGRKGISFVGKRIKGA